MRAATKPPAPAPKAKSPKKSVYKKENRDLQRKVDRLDSSWDRLQSARKVDREENRKLSSEVRQLEKNKRLDKQLILDLESKVHGKTKEVLQLEKDREADA